MDKISIHVHVAAETLLHMRPVHQFRVLKSLSLLNVDTLCNIILLRIRLTSWGLAATSVITLDSLTRWHISCYCSISN